MAFSNTAYNSVAQLSLWFKVQNNASLVLADIPEIIPLRWNYLRDNWEFIKSDVENKISTYEDPDLLKKQLDSFTAFVDAQRFAADNPLRRSNILFSYHSVWNSLELDSIDLTRQEQDIVDGEISTVGDFTKNNFLDLRVSLIEERDKQADLIGGADDTYNELYHRSSIAQQLDRTILSIQEMQVLQQQILTIELVLANIKDLDTVSVDPFLLAKQNANNSDYELAQYSSGKLVRFNFGEDLKSVAGRFLGDQDRWLEVAIANGLRPPYIDEIGERIPFISNASGNQINLSKLDSNSELNRTKLFINQIVLLQSDTEPFTEQRVIININEIPVSGELVIELDGDSDLEKYKLEDNAYIRVFKPNTINSSFYILIPSNNPIVTDLQNETPWFLRTSGEDEKRAKVDLLIGDGSDLSFDSTNDLALSYGISNAIQSVKIKMVIQQGELVRHLTFGLVEVIGKTNQNTDEIESRLIKSINNLIDSDDRFDRLERLDVEYFVDSIVGASGYNIAMIVRLAGGDKVIPISFTINLP